MLRLLKFWNLNLLWESLLKYFGGAESLRLCLYASPANSSNRSNTLPKP